MMMPMIHIILKKKKSKYEDCVGSLKCGWEADCVDGKWMTSLLNDFRLISFERVTIIHLCLKG